MPRETKKDALVRRSESASEAGPPSLLHDLLVALRDVSYGELAKGGTAGPAWRQLHDVVAGALGDEAAPRAQPVQGRQPMMMPPARSGAQRGGPAPGPTVSAPTEATAIVALEADIRQRTDVAAELARINGGITVTRAEGK